MHPLELILNIFAIYMQVFAIMDPFGIVPIYIGLTEGLDHIDRRRVVNHIAIVCTALILIFTVSGKWILNFFGISIPAVRIGGGILLLAIAIDMLGELPKAKQVEDEELATVPLATVLILCYKYIKSYESSGESSRLEGSSAGFRGERDSPHLSLNILNFST